MLLRVDVHICEMFQSYGLQSLCRCFTDDLLSLIIFPENGITINLRHIKSQMLPLEAKLDSYFVVLFD